MYGKLSGKLFSVSYVYMHVFRPKYKQNIGPFLDAIQVVVTISVSVGGVQGSEEETWE